MTTEVTDPTPIGSTPPDLSERVTAPRPTAAPRVLVAAALAGVAVDRLPSGGVGFGVAVLLLVLPVLLVAAGGAQRWWAKAQLLPILAIAPWVAVRANATIQLLDIAACLGLIALSVTSGPIAKSPLVSADPPLIRAGHGVASFVDAPRYAGAGVKRVVATRGDGAAAVVRGLLYGLPVALVVTALLASADRSFASIFETGNTGSNVRHVAVAVGGAVVFAGLVRSAVTPRWPAVWWTPRLGRVEAVAILDLFVLIYAAFVAARLLDPGNTATNPRQLADEARAGFFQLVAVVAITVAVLWVIRAATAVRDRAIVGLAIAVVGLTLVLVGIALHRLSRYRDEFGLTELRLGTTWFSMWLGLVVFVIGVSYVVKARANRFTIAIVVSALVWLVAWNATNPDQRIAEVNMQRAVDGARFDPELLGDLSADAIPAIVGRLGALDGEQRDAVLEQICDRRFQESPNGLGSNASIESARTRLDRACADWWSNGS